MARRSFTGLGRIYWCKQITDVLKPAAAEIAAGDEITHLVKRDGLKTPTSTNTIDISDASSLWNKSAPGTKGGDAITINAWRDSLGTADLVWNLMRDEEMGFLVVSRWGNAQDKATGLGKGPSAMPPAKPTLDDRVEVYTCTVTARASDDIGTDANAVTITLGQTGAPSFDAVVTGTTAVKKLPAPASVKAKGTPKATEFEVEWPVVAKAVSYKASAVKHTFADGEEPVTVEGVVAEGDYVDGKPTTMGAAFTGLTTATQYDVTVVAVGDHLQDGDSDPAKTSVTTA
ncbi:hypothetical protein ACN20G_28165 (plasmid) [Streptomyces sp. BI20]|uniref:phage tail tube protein n=1 Tax=Streptomyces sp. BI20 TaxID=3403460 RepID=UPI003C70BCEC